MKTSSRLTQRPMGLWNRTVGGRGQSLFELRLPPAVKTYPARTKVKGARLNHLRA